MEHEDTFINGNLKAAFNNGYFIGRYKEDIAKMLMETLGKNAANTEVLKMAKKGFETGLLDLEKEKRVKINLEDFKKIRQNKEQSKNLDRDID